MSKVFERHNQAMYDTVRLNMTFINLPLYLLSYALVTTVFYTEKSTIKSVEMTSYEIWYGNIKNILSFLKIWIYETYVWHTQSPKSDKCYFVKVIPKGLVFLYHYTKAKFGVG